MGYFPDSVLLKVGWRALFSSRAACIASALALSLKTHSVSSPVGTSTSSYLLFFCVPLFPVFCWVTCLFPTIHHQELLLLLVKSHVKLQSSTCSCCLPTMILVIFSHLTLSCYQLSRFYENLMPCLLLWALQLAYHTVVATCLISDMGGAVLLYWMSPVHFTNNWGCWWSSCFQPEVMLSCIVRLSPYH